MQKSASQFTSLAVLPLKNVIKIYFFTKIATKLDWQGGEFYIWVDFEVSTNLAPERPVRSYKTKTKVFMCCAHMSITTVSGLHPCWWKVYYQWGLVITCW